MIRSLAAEQTIDSALDAKEAATLVRRPRRRAINLRACHSRRVVQDAFTHGADLQRASLACTARQLAALCQQTKPGRDIDFCPRLAGEVTGCIAGAADANVRIWFDLVQRVRHALAQIDATLETPEAKTAAQDGDIGAQQSMLTDSRSRDTARTTTP